MQLSGVVCGVCAMRSEAAFRGTDGVETASVDLDTQRATLHLSPDAGSLSRDALQQSLEDAVVGMTARRWLERLAAGLRTGFGRGRS